PIQERAIPALMSGRDVLGQAQTGTGKTAAFALPMLHGLETDDAHGHVQGLVVAPTRELANQVAKAVYEYGRHRGVRVLAVYGGQSYSRQISRLQRGVDIVIGTPGRMLDLIRKDVLDLSAVRYLVLDEADEMLSMGFIEDIEAILSETPSTRQTALFSATLPDPIRRLADRYMSTPEAITINPKRLTVAETEQRYYVVNEEDKFAALTRLLEMEDMTSALVFTRTKVRASELANALFERGIQAEELHGDLSQQARETVMNRFRRGQVAVLVATDVAARGLDVDDVSHVVNYDMPFDPEIYVHRIGRTGRAGKSGIALMLATPRERRRLQEIEAFTMQPITRAKLPTTAEILARRNAQFLLKMGGQLDGELGDALDNEHALVAHMVAAGYAVSDIAAAAIRLARAQEQQRPIEEIREAPLRPQRHAKFVEKSKRSSKRAPRLKGEREPGMVRLLLNAGAVHGIRPRDIVGAIAGETGIPGRAIGAIEIQPQQTFVDVAERHANHVLHKMKHWKVRGRAVVLKASD
ncbi:MAG: DEAD/DEAH box helicase, partial [Anaerolineae bacterium]|nr:DEAD/DEAH box helicase [Anaerolineae bacterium]